MSLRGVHDWVTLAPGVRWFARRPDGLEQAAIEAHVAKTMGAIHDGRASLEGLGFGDADLGLLSDVTVLAGLSVFTYAHTCAVRFVDAWEGVTDEDGEPLPVNPDTIAAALRYGAEGDGPALLRPWTAYLEGPREPVAAEKRRLRLLAEFVFGGGQEHCNGCALAGAACASGGTDHDPETGERARCPQTEHAPQTVAGIAAWRVALRPGVWSRAGIDGVLVGLDYKAAMEMVDADGVGDVAAGTLYSCLAAIESGALKASSERREAQAAAGAPAGGD